MEFKKSIGSSVVSLLKPACPPAIIFFVIPVIVDSIKRRARRRLSHVLKEIIKGLKPSIAHLDSSAAVILEIFAIRITASVFNDSKNVSCFNVRYRRHVFGLLFGA